jgi:GNAT superfamily N-acetyltransferase
VTSERQTSTDELVSDLLARHPLQFTVASDPDARREAFALRHAAVIANGWGPPSPDGLDRDGFDDRAVILVGRFEDEVVATGRLVLPPGPLPTEVECSIQVQPQGQVVDVGRMVVAPERRGWGRGSFAALLAALYVEMRRNGYAVATGMMAPDVRSVVRLLGLNVEVLGADRSSNGTLRAPVRFACDANEGSLLTRWGDESRPPSPRSPG